MIESIVNAFAKNSFIFSSRKESGGDFQQTLENHEQQIQNQDQSQYSSNDNYDYTYEDDYKPGEYTDVREEDVEEVENSVNEESTDEDTEKVTEESSEQPIHQLDITALLKELGLSEESLKSIQKIVSGKDGLPGKELLNKLLTELKASLSKNMPPDLFKKVEAFTEKLQQFLKNGNTELTKDLKNILNNAGVKNTPSAREASEFKPEVESHDKVDRMIKHNNARHYAMKEVAQDAKNVKFSSEIDPRFAQDTKKSNQAFQARQAQFHAMSGASAQKQPQGGMDQNQEQSSGEASLKSPNFIKKMKAILNNNSQNSQSPDFSLNQQGKVQVNNMKPAFMNRVANGQFMQQLVDRIQSMVKANTTLSASVDFKSAEFGDMKLAAEAQGTSLAVKISNIASTMKIDVLSLKSELDTELKNLGFESVEIDFGSGSEGGGNSNAFEQEMQKRLSGEHVKLPGDHLADLKAIDEWMKDFEKVM